MDLLVIGGSGLLGRELVRQSGKVGGTYHSHAPAIDGVDWWPPAETAVKGLDPAAVIVRTSLIIGRGDSTHEAYVHALAAGTRDGALFTDDIRCPVQVADLASAVLELAGSRYAGIHHVAGPEAVTRHQFGVLVARRDGLDDTALPAGPRPRGPLDIRLDCALTQSRLTTRLRAATEFLSR